MTDHSSSPGNETLVQRLRELHSEMRIMIGGIAGEAAAEIERLNFELKAVRNEIEIADGEIERLSAAYEQMNDAFIAASDAATPAQGWRDISTAPRDGSKIDLLYPYPRGRQNDCQWRTGDVYGEGGWYWSIPQWGSQPGLGIDWHLLPEDKWEVGSYPNMEPTHWMHGPMLPSTMLCTPAEGE